VIGGGASLAARRDAALVQDTMRSALVELLEDAAAPARPPSLARQLGDRLAALLADAGDRLATLRGSIAAGPAAEPARAPNPIPLQPPAPPGPTYTLDPTLGTIVELEPPRGHGRGDDGGGGGSGSASDGSTASPSSWLPIPGWRIRPELLDRLGSIADRIDALLDEAGITRLQLLALTILVPLGTVFLIAVVDRLVS
jgi:hypothetical protein